MIEARRFHKDHLENNEGTITLSNLDGKKVINYMSIHIMQILF